MTARLRHLLSAAAQRRTARHLAGIQFCDSCAQVCDATCRAESLREHTLRSALIHIR